MGIVMLEVCESNQAALLDLEILENEYPGVSVLRNECVSHCQLCAQTPYVLINGEIVANEDINKLLAAVRVKIELELTEWQ